MSITLPSELSITHGRGGRFKAHKPGCKRITEAQRVLVLESKDVESIDAASCCKPGTQAMETYCGTLARLAAEESIGNHVDAAFAEAPKMIEAAPPAAVPSDEAIAAATDAVVAEMAANAGAIGEVLDAEAKAGRRTAPRASKLPVAYQEALAAKKAGKRGAGRKLTDEEMVGVARSIHERHPELTGRQAMEVAYWIDKVALTIPRWEKAWSALGAAPAVASSAA